MPVQPFFKPAHLTYILNFAYNQGSGCFKVKCTRRRVLFFTRTVTWYQPQKPLFSPISAARAGPAKSSPGAGTPESMFIRSPHLSPRPDLRLRPPPMHLCPQDPPLCLCQRLPRPCQSLHQRPHQPPNQCLDLRHLYSPRHQSTTALFGNWGTTQCAHAWTNTKPNAFHAGVALQHRYGVDGGTYKAGEPRGRGPPRAWPAEMPKIQLDLPPPHASDLPTPSTVAEVLLKADGNPLKDCPWYLSVHKGDYC